MESEAPKPSGLLAMDPLGASSGQADWVALPREYNATTHFIDRHLDEGRAAKVAFIDNRGSYTYAELADRVNRAGNVLRGLGVEVEQRVMLCVLDSVDFPALFWGAIKIGAVPVPVSTLLTPADYDYMLRDSRARLLGVSGQLFDRFEAILPKQPYLKAMIAVGGPGTDTPGSQPSFEALSACASGSLEPAETQADDTAFWLYTSGSTG
jgi:acyl-coenzyme A synthetase/AMP-(fatty) acid ligase